MGQSWEPFSKGLTSAAVHDLVIQEKENHLVVGTHGRSIYVADISNIQKADANFLEKPLHFFEIKHVNHSKNWGNKRSSWVTPNIPSLELFFYNKTTSIYDLIIKKNRELF